MQLDPSFEISFGLSAGAVASSTHGGGSPTGNSHGYDALDNKGRRKAAPTTVIREDTIVKGGRRVRLQANANDIARNFSIAAWAIRRHLDYVSRFTFHARCKDRGLNRDVEELIKIRSMKDNCDRGGRMSRERLFRLLEARRVLDGDVGLILLNDKRVQVIEGDLIRNPEKLLGPHEWVDGVEADHAGKAIQYSVWSRPRGGVGYKWKRNVPARNFLHYGFFERCASDQYRGISPIVASLNNYRDVYEKIEYALIKSKIEQLFALALTRDKDAEALDSQMPGANGTDDESDDEEESNELPPRTIDLTHGPTVLDLDPGEDAKILESGNPSNEFQAFTRLVIMIALKALDIPYSFFDESHTNYSGSRTGWLHYERSTLTNRDDQTEIRTGWTDFQLRHAILDGSLVLPSRMGLDEVKYEWVPQGMPWWKPSEEIVGDLKAIASGLDSPISITKARGTGDIFDNVDDLIEVIKYAHEQGSIHLGEPLRLNFDPGPFAPAVMTNNQENQ
ncbi:MAG: phage portal protein [Pirellula sp.]